ncbi:hypothetical protein CBM2586_A50450 [Cupriavidus phytorum]|uniref:Uncharacterized protein n=1 Tax=Cupriavidus taiwanensis TaxID=164546 RepID=A0A375C436_9BURK|nr:hypothetical protein CBM2586_A50450 [Cupriavidus taiwanensis]
MDKLQEPSSEVIWSRTRQPLGVATLNRIAPSGRRSPLRLAARGPVRLDPGARRARDVASHSRFGLQKRAQFVTSAVAVLGYLSAEAEGKNEALSLR